MRYQSTRPKRQFLAGVSCPSCNHTDTIVQVQIFIPSFDEYIECINCNHQERRPSKEDIATINQPADQNGVGIVKFK
ncbi:hypothetical protein SAMN02745664_102216 [Moraxella cuniculi DSM 21768]|uniref:Metal-binding protein (DUF2387) n=1 Tax=Moraxella cuniculi DSM 21768 TaxID=1122245 RepID=A0A1N7DY52_9GAMM|nr:YheV family putative metal-binding protein [Moraxella cuniculi]OOS07353.1 hypothetical protein B0189_02675 [Moraxella cuniculi]SIR80711.1 hypothetical protein SAMN02745664_102216 [Moraxella cuniculi DSM 21768]